MIKTKDIDINDLNEVRDSLEADGYELIADLIDNLYAQIKELNDKIALIEYHYEVRKNRGPKQ